MFRTLLWACCGWALFGSAQACPEVDPQALTLAAAAARALCLEPAQARVQAELRQAQAGIQERQAALSPQWSATASASGSAQRTEDRSSASYGPNARLQLNHTLLDGGARQRRVGQSRADAVASELLVRQNQLDVQLDFIGLWLDARRTQAALAASEAALRAAQASLAAVRAREQLGSATAVESLAAASAQAQAQRELIAAEQARLKASGLLAQRLGWPAATPVVLAGDDGAVLPAATLEESRLSLEQHPQLLAQQARVQALQEALQATRSEGGGSLSLTGQLGPSSSRSNTLTQQYRSIHSVDASVGLTWSMPLSDGGSRQATIARAQAQLDAAHANQDSTRRSLQDNLWRALSDWRSASADSSASGVALQAATASEAAQRGRYGAGVGTVADLLQAQSELAQRRQQLLAAQQQQQRAWAAVLHAAGQTPLQASTLSP